MRSMYLLFAFEPNGERPHIYNPDPALAETVEQARAAVHLMTKAGIHAWYQEVRVGRWR